MYFRRVALDDELQATQVQSRSLLGFLLALGGEQKQYYLLHFEARLLDAIDHAQQFLGQSAIGFPAAGYFLDWLALGYIFCRSFCLSLPLLAYFIGDVVELVSHVLVKQECYIELVADGLVEHLLEKLHIPQRHYIAHGLQLGQTASETAPLHVDLLDNCLQTATCLI